MNFEESLTKKSIDGGLTYTIQVFLYFLMTIIYTIIISLFQITPDDLAYYYLSFIASPIAIGICLFVMGGVRKVERADMIPLSCHYRYLIIALLLWFGVTFSLTWINEWVLKILLMWGYKPTTTLSNLDVILQTCSIGQFLLFILSVAILPAVMEEILFRGVIINSVRRGLGDVGTVLFVGFLFALFHGSPEQTVYQLLCGFILAFLAIRSHSILPTMILHFGNNLFILLASRYQWYDYTLLATGSISNIILSIVGLICLMVGLLWLCFDKQTLQKRSRGQSKYIWGTSSIGIVAMSIMWVFSLIGA